MRWIGGLILLALAAVVVVGNLVGGLRARRAGRGFSSVPFIAAALGSIGSALLPVGDKAWLFAAVLVLDFTVSMALVALVRRAFGR